MAQTGDALCAESRALQPLLSLNDEARLAMYAPDFALPEKYLEDAASLLGAQSWMLVRPPSEKRELKA